MMIPTHIMLLLLCSMGNIVTATSKDKTKWKSLNNKEKRVKVTQYLYPKTEEDKVADREEMAKRLGFEGKMMENYPERISEWIKKCREDLPFLETSARLSETNTLNETHFTIMAKEGRLLKPYQFDLSDSLL